MQQHASNFSCHVMPSVSQCDQRCLPLLIGPFSAGLCLQAVEFVGISQDAAIDWLQQWGTSITFGCEVPFPSPLQCDPVPDGVRFAVISAAGGNITSLGELYLEVDGERLEAEQIASVAVTRVSKTPERALPGEREILKTLKNALRCAAVAAL